LCLYYGQLGHYNRIIDLKKHMQNLKSILELGAQDCNREKLSPTSSECMQSFIEDGFTKSWQLSLKQSNYMLGLPSVIVSSLGLPLHNFFLFFNAKFRMLHTSLYISMSTRNNYLARSWSELFLIHLQESPSSPSCAEGWRRKRSTEVGF